MSALLNCSVTSQVSLRPSAWVRGKRRKAAVVDLGVLAVRLGCDVRRGPLEHRDVTGLGLDARHELDRAGAGAEHRDALAPQVDRVVPLRRVEGRSLERAQPGQLGDRGSRELAHGRDDDVGVDAFTGRRLEVPDGAFFVVRRRAHLDPCPHEVEHSLLTGGSFDVREDLVLAGVAVRPPGVGRERPRVEGRGNVARCVGVGVLAPHATDAVCLLQDRDVAVAGSLQLHGGAEPTEAGTDDGDRWLAHGGTLVPLVAPPGPRLRCMDRSCGARLYDERSPCPPLVEPVQPRAVRRTSTWPTVG